MLEARLEKDEIVRQVLASARRAGLEARPEAGAVQGVAAGAAQGPGTGAAQGSGGAPRVLLGLSGGADSTALLFALREAAGQLGC